MTTEHTPDITIISAGAGEDARPVAVKINGTSYSPAAVEEAVRDIVWLRAMFSDLRAALGLHEGAPSGLVVSTVAAWLHEMEQLRTSLAEDAAVTERLQKELEQERARREIAETEIIFGRAAAGAAPGQDLAFAITAMQRRYEQELTTARQLADADNIPEPLVRLVHCLRADNEAARALETFEAQSLPRAIHERVMGALTSHRWETRANLLIALDACKELVPVEPEAEEVDNAA